jgi:hypothetical protein
VGLPCPLNSVGSLPTHYLKLSKADEVEAVLANTKQILNQFLRKSRILSEHDLNFAYSNCLRSLDILFLMVSCCPAEVSY